jgi:hypothetical protein
MVGVVLGHELSWGSALDGVEEFSFSSKTDTTRSCE